MRNKNKHQRANLQLLQTSSHPTKLYNLRFITSLHIVSLTCKTNRSRRPPTNNRIADRFSSRSSRQKIKGPRSARKRVKRDERQKSRMHKCLCKRTICFMNGNRWMNKDGNICESVRETDRAGSPNLTLYEGTSARLHSQKNWRRNELICMICL